MSSPYGALRSYLLDTTQFVGLLWTSDSPTQIPLLDNTINSQTSMPRRDSNNSATANSHLRPCGQWDRLM